MTHCAIDPFLAQVCECGRAAARIPMGEVLRPRPWESDIRYRYVGVVWRGFTPPSRRSRAGKEEVPPPMTRSNLDRWEDCGEAPQGTSLAQLRSNVPCGASPQSSITSLLSAMDLRAASEQELRECESKWKSLEAGYRARSNI